MKNKKLTAVLIALSAVLCGCNTVNDDPDISGGTVPSIGSVYDIDSASIIENEPVPEVTSVSPVSSETEKSEESKVNSVSGSENPEKSSEEKSYPPAETTSENKTEVDEKETAESSSETKRIEKTTISETDNNGESAATAPPAPRTTAPVTTAVTSVHTTKDTTTTIQTTTAPPETTTAPVPPSPATVLVSSADGILTQSNERATIDYSHSSDGYVMAKYTGPVEKIKIQIITPSGTKQNYNLKSDGTYESYPLTGSNGTYTVNVLEYVSGKNYALANTVTIDVDITDPFSPFLRPSQYVNFSAGDSAVTLASQLCAGTANALEKVDKVYSWLVDNVVYDHEFAASDIVKGYAGDTYKVVKQKKGICLDYAATMAAMLRSQNVPTQVISGDVNGGGFHAWVKVYVKDVGWVYAGAIYFDGTGWQRMDPTYAASSNSDKSILDFIANGNNYVTDFIN